MSMRRILSVLLLMSAVLLCAPNAAYAKGESAAVVVIDAGHGGEDGGAVSSGGVPESGINLQIAKNAEWIFLFLGQPTAMTRSGEGAVYSPEASTLREKKVSDLKNRVAQINGYEAAFVISIHQNSLPSHPKVHGAQVFYNTVLPAAVAAGAVQEKLNEAVNTDKPRTVSAISSSIYLMKESRHPAILVECGFLSNPRESEILQDAAYQMRLATAIVAGYCQFCRNGE
ncbi:MAG: N-acetylmuramoyl-L-alanine amidase [Oscillospiraceae bacterium]|nr:N-acetylmuramoyl-L-alanine amidase [Oscillospiraceae bacterium]